MKRLYLIRHSLTEANERHLYGGSTDCPLTEQGRRIAAERRGCLPACDLYITSGMLRAAQTLELMTERQADLVLPELSEMDFGAFEMRSYEMLKCDPDYIRWIEDKTGEVRCPGGECMSEFRTRVLNAGNALLQRLEDSALVVCHGGSIVNLMQAWFPKVERNFYEWQPAACRGWCLSVENAHPSGFEAV